jgi:hypothetical protein
MKETQTMATYTSRAQDAGQKIKEAMAAVENADVAYRNGGSLAALNKANRRLVDATHNLYEVDSGIVRDPSAGN